MADIANRHAAGIMFIAPDGDVLLMRRLGDDVHRGAWAFPGGSIEQGETPAMAATREAEEETGRTPGAKRFLDGRPMDNGAIFHTFVSPVADKFAPTLNEEHSGFCWAPMTDPPQPLHPGVAATLKERTVQPAADMKPEDWKGLVDGFVKWAGEESEEPEHAADSMAMDRNSVRSYDKDGRLHVEITNISKAAVNEYLGREIPNWIALGLIATKKYKLLRDPDELAKGASTFNNIPLLSRHVPVTARDHQPHLVIGSTGTDAVFEAPYLRNSLVIWAGDGVQAIEDEIQKELSSAYRYRADMTPGSYEGEAYDGVMRDIVANHVALVREGRAGSDVVVGDSKEELNMSKSVLSRKAAVAKGLLLAALTPKLAKDAKMIDLTPILEKVTAKNFKDSKPAILAGVKTAFAPVMAMDASLEDVVTLLDCLDNDQTMEAQDADPKAGPQGAAQDEDPKEKFLKEKLSAEDKKAFDALGGKTAMDADETDEEKKAREAKEKKAADSVNKPAMDEAIAKASEETEKRVSARFKAIREAEKAVAPYTGALSMAFDSADEVYKHALTAMEVDVDGVHPSAYPALLKMVPVPGSKPRSPQLAMDGAAASDSFNKMFPDAARIGNA